jgi:uncharacterized phage-like protein YoqJ
MEKESMILAITGHRPHKLGGYIIPNPIANEVITKLRESLVILKPEVVLSGMALGVDQWVAQICIDLGVPFDAIIAFEGYETKWPRQSQDWFKHLMAKARKKVLLSTGAYSPSLLHERNYWLVNNSDALLAVWDGRPGSGTASCVQYAQLKQPPKPIYRLSLSEEMWAIASGEERIIKGRKEERLWRSQNEIQPMRQQRPAPQPTDSLEFRRFVDVGDDDS